MSERQSAVPPDGNKAISAQAEGGGVLEKKGTPLIDRGPDGFLWQTARALPAGGGFCLPVNIHFPRGQRNSLRAPAFVVS